MNNFVTIDIFYTGFEQNYVEHKMSTDQQCFVRYTCKKTNRNAIYFKIRLFCSVISYEQQGKSERWEEVNSYTESTPYLD